MTMSSVRDETYSRYDGHKEKKIDVVNGKFKG